MSAVLGIQYRTPARSIPQVFLQWTGIHSVTICSAPSCVARRFPFFWAFCAIDEITLFTELEIMGAVGVSMVHNFYALVNRASPVSIG